MARWTPRSAGSERFVPPTTYLCRTCPFNKVSRIRVLGRSRALRSAAGKHERICLDLTCRGLKEKNQFACEYGHVTRISPRNLIRQRELGCRECAQIAATACMHRLAQPADSICLNAKWRGTAARYRFCCNGGHRWSCGGQSLLRGAGCTVCAALNGQLTGVQLLNGLKRFQDAAAQTHGGRCLADRYNEVRAQYTFDCAEGHGWQTAGVLRGSWCWRCANAPVGNILRRSDGLAMRQAKPTANGGEWMDGQYLGTHRC